AGLEISLIKGPVSLDGVQDSALGRGLAGSERKLANDRSGGAVLELELDRLGRIGAELECGLVRDGSDLANLAHSAARQADQGAIERKLEGRSIHRGAVVGDPQFD